MLLAIFSIIIGSDFMCRIKNLNIEASTSHDFIKNLINKLTELQQEYNPYIRQRFDQNIPYTYYFRGTSNYDYELISGIHRDQIDEFNNINSWDGFKAFILSHISKINSFYEKFSNETSSEIKFLKYAYDEFQNSKIINQPEVNEKNRLSFMQHYSIDADVKTPFIDLTKNIFISLFFAANGNPNKDGALWLINKESFMVHYESWYHPPEEVLSLLFTKMQITTRPDYINFINDLYHIDKSHMISLITFFKNKYPDFEHLKYSEEYIPVLMKFLIELFKIKSKEAHSIIEEKLYDGGFNERLCRQQGLFILQSFLPICLTKEIFNSKICTRLTPPISTPFTKIRIPKEYKKDILDFLDYSLGYNETSLYLTQ